MKVLFRLIPFLRPYGGQVLLAFTATIGITLINLVVPTIIRYVIDYGLGEDRGRLLLFAAAVLLFIGIIRSGLLYAQRFLGEWIAAHIGYDLRNRLFDHLQHLPFSFHDVSQTGQLISRCIEDVRAVERFTGFGLMELIRLMFLLIGIVSLLFWQQPRLAVIALLPVLPLIIMTTRFGRLVSAFFMDVDVALGELSALLQENITGIQVVRAFAREPYEIERFEQGNRKLYKARVRVLRAFGRIMPTSHLLVTLSTILILWFGGRMVLQGEMTIGEVVAFNSYLLMLAAPAQQLTWLVNSAGEAAAGLKRSLEVLDLDPQIKNAQDAISLPAISGEVEFQNVCFHYEGRNLPALEDINLNVEPNQLVALVGPTGSGKTSFVNLISRFYDISQGAVLIDGYDVRQVDLISLRSQIGIVLQSSFLFSTTIAENIAYGRPNTSLDEIMAAAKAAQAHEFILQLPEGYQTEVGERGITLSGGQRQRIAIARALLMNPRILILDDSTSSVDTETEKLIQQALEELMRGRTTFVIAHRISTVRRADLILVMQGGRIIERGTHEQLLHSGGLYREIYNLQLYDQEKLHEEFENMQLVSIMIDMPQKSRRLESPQSTTNDDE